MKTLSRGVTLIELAVVLAVVAILFSQAAPAFSAWVHNTQVRTAAESIQNGMQLARAEAIRRNRSVMFWLTSTATPHKPTGWSDARTRSAPGRCRRRPAIARGGPPAASSHPMATTSSGRRRPTSRPRDAGGDHAGLSQQRHLQFAGNGDAECRWQRSDYPDRCDRSVDSDASARRCG